MVSKKKYHLYTKYLIENEILKNKIFLKYFESILLNNDYLESRHILLNSNVK